MLCGPSLLYFLFSFFPVDCIFLQTACWGWTVLGTAISSLVNLETSFCNLKPVFQVGRVVDLPARTNLHCCQHLLFPQHIQVHKFYFSIQTNYCQCVTGFCWQSWEPHMQTNQQISGHNLHVTARWFIGNNALSETCVVNVRRRESWCSGPMLYKQYLLINAHNRTAVQACSVLVPLFGLQWLVTFYR